MCFYFIYSSLKYFVLLFFCTNSLGIQLKVNAKENERVPFNIHVDAPKKSFLGPLLWKM